MKTPKNTPNDQDHGGLRDDLIERMVDLDESVAVADLSTGAEESAPGDESQQELEDLSDCLLLLERVRRNSPECIADLMDEDSPGSLWLDGGDDYPTQIGRFQIRRKLGGGGFGLVFLAVDPRLERDVALKVPRVEALVTEQTRQRFLRESKAAASLNHPNIASVYDAGRVGPICYIASEFCAGGSLADWLKKLRVADEGSIDVQTAVSLMLVLADAVQHAHNRGILHRDLKPSNILFDAASSPFNSGDLSRAARLVDFGLAKTLDAHDDPDADDQTRTGVMLGTPAYMSPEQAEGIKDRVGVGCDIYSLGAILYELLTGKPPFKRDSDIETILALKTEEAVAPRRLNTNCPQDLQAICMKCLEKSPNQRYRSAAELGDDLRRFAAGDPIVARSIGRRERLVRWSRRNPAVASLMSAVAVLLIAVAGISLAALNQALNSLEAEKLARNQANANEELARRALFDSQVAVARSNRTSGRPEARTNALDAVQKAASLIQRLKLTEEDILPLRNEAISAMALTGLSVDKEWPDVSGRSTDIVSTGFDAQVNRFARRETGGDVVVRGLQTNDEQVRLAVGGRDRTFIQFSPDGRFLAVRVEDNQGRVRMQVWRLGDTNKQLLDRVGGGAKEDRSFDFSRDGKRFAVWGGEGAIEIFDTNSWKKSKHIELSSRPLWIRFDPQGERIAALLYRETKRRLVVVEASSGREMLQLDLTKYGPLIGDWSPDGRLLATAADDGNVYVWDVQQGTLRRSCPGHRMSVRQVAFNRSGTLLMGATARDDITYLWDPHTGRRLLKAEGFGVRFSQDDRWLGMGHAGVTYGRWEVHTSGVFSELGRHDEMSFIDDMQMDFSPNGRLMATVTRSDGVRLWDVLGKEQIAHVDLNAYSAAFSHDGRTLYVAGQDSGLQAWPLRADAQDRSRLILGPLRSLNRKGYRFTQVALSREQKTAALNTDEQTVAVLDMADDDPSVQTLISHPQVQFHALSPDGAWLATGTWHSSGVKVWNAKTGELAKELPVAGGARVTFSPDGRWLATSSYNEHAFWSVGNWNRGHSIGHGGFTHSRVAFDGQGRLAAASFPTHVKLVDPSSGREIASMWPPPGFSSPMSLAFSADGRRLAVGTTVTEVYLWDLARIRQELRGLGLDWRQGELPVEPAHKIKSFQVHLDLRGLAPWPSRTPRMLENLAKHSANIAANPENVYELRRRANTYAYLRRFEDAIKDCDRALAIKPGYWPAHFWRGHAYMNLRQHEKSMEDFRKSLQASPNDVWACRHQAWNFIVAPAELRDARQAKELAQKAVDLAHRSNPPTPLADCLRVLGMAHYRLNEYKRALDVFEKVRTEFPKLYTARVLLFQAMCHHQLGQHDQARACYHVALPTVARDTRRALGDVEPIRIEAKQLLGIPSP